MTALLLLGPWTPLLFQGEEFGASSPFMFFADIGDASVRDAIRKGRAEWLAPFLSLSEDEARKTLPAPDDPEVFAHCKLDFSEREKNRQLYDLHIDLLKLRREDSRFRQQIPGGIDGAVSGNGEFRSQIFFKGGRRSPVVSQFRRTPGPAPCFRASFGAAIGLHMGDTLDKRVSLLRRSRRGSNRK